MPSPERPFTPASTTPAPGSVALRFTVSEFATPPVRDALVMGKRSPVGSMALRKALAFLNTSPYTHIEIEDDVIGDIIAREAIVRLVGKDKFIMDRIKPLMTDMDILHLHVDATLHMEAEV